MAPKDYKHTPEAIEKIRQSKLGVKQTPETIAARFAYRETTIRIDRTDLSKVLGALENAEIAIANAIRFFEAKLQENR